VHTCTFKLDLRLLCTWQLRSQLESSHFSLFFTCYTPLLFTFAYPFLSSSPPLLFLFLVISGQCCSVLFKLVIIYIYEYVCMCVCASAAHVPPYPPCYSSHILILGVLSLVFPFSSAFLSILVKLHTAKLVGAFCFSLFSMFSACAYVCMCVCIQTHYAAAGFLSLSYIFLSLYKYAVVA